MKEFSTNVAHNYKSYSDMISLANLKETVDVKKAEEYGRIRHLITPEAKAEGRHIDFISESTILQYLIKNLRQGTIYKIAPCFLFNMLQVFAFIRKLNYNGTDKRVLIFWGGNYAYRRS